MQNRNNFASTDVDALIRTMTIICQVDISRNEKVLTSHNRRVAC